MTCVVLFLCYRDVMVKCRIVKAVTEIINDECMEISYKLVKSEVTLKIMLNNIEKDFIVYY
jgi:hypothetical protein